MSAERVRKAENLPAAAKTAVSAASKAASVSRTVQAPHLEQTAAKSSKKRKRVDRSQAARSARAARTAQLKKAFTASSELRPMAQQLMNTRTPEAFAGVTNYARKHTGEAAAAAYLAIGRAYMLEHKWEEAIENLNQARKAGEVLGDYAEFFMAQASFEAGKQEQAASLLRGFEQRHPDSVFDVQVPEQEARVLRAAGNPQAAQMVLKVALGTGAASRTGFQLEQGETALALGQHQLAGQYYKQLMLSHPLTADGQTARIRLKGLGLDSELTTSELRTLADAYYNAGRNQDAAEEYRALSHKPGLDAETRNGFLVAVAACELKLKTLTTAKAMALDDTSDDNGARRLYLLMELARNRDAMDDQQQIVEQMKTRFPQSRWLAEALFSSGNMYLLKRDYARAAGYYGALAAMLPTNSRAATAHWRSAWLNFRMGQKAEAARLFDDQIRRYPSVTETVAARYWRARIYELQEGKPAQAAALYRGLVRYYPNFYYAQLARQRLTAMGEKPSSAAQAESASSMHAPRLVDEFPAESPHLAKARLLANAGLNDWIAQEIAADPDSGSWSALAEAQIYASYGETHRALRSLKRALPSAASTPVAAIPLAYWRILFPEPWWSTIQAESAKNGLDPYLVASLIRQESEFNPGAISPANAYGLMQMLPTVGKNMAHDEGLSHFGTFQLLDPETNIRLGTRYLRRTLDKFGGVAEYALAAYNAGDNRVTDWQGNGPYSGLDEFVEAIPFTETREYVQAILRNRETYRAIDEYAATLSRKSSAASH